MHHRVLRDFGPRRGLLVLPGAEPVPKELGDADPLPTGDPVSTLGDGVRGGSGT